MSYFCVCLLPQKNNPCPQVLENFHCRSAFFLMESHPSAAFLQSLDTAEYRRFRRILTDVILGTDMAMHQSIISSFDTEKGMLVCGFKGPRFFNSIIFSFCVFPPLFFRCACSGPYFTSCEKVCVCICMYTYTCMCVNACIIKLYTYICITVFVLVCASLCH